MNNSPLKLSRYSGLFSIGLFCLCAVVLSACSKKASQAIVGKWNVQGESAVVEFRQDGTLVSMEGKHTNAGTYSFTDNAHMQMAINEVTVISTNLVKIDCEIVVKGDEATVGMSRPDENGGKSKTRTAHLHRLQ